ESHDADSSSEISPDTPMYTATIEAEVDDLESGEWLGDVILTGGPAGFTVAITGGADADSFELVNNNGTWTLQWKDDVERSDRKELDVDLSIVHPDGLPLAGAEIKADVQAF